MALCDNSAGKLGDGGARGRQDDTVNTVSPPSSRVESVAEFAGRTFAAAPALLSYRFYLSWLCFVRRTISL